MILTFGAFFGTLTTTNVVELWSLGYHASLGWNEAL